MCRKRNHATKWQKGDGMRRGFTFLFVFLFVFSAPVFSIEPVDSVEEMLDKLVVMIAEKGATDVAIISSHNDMPASDIVRRLLYERLMDEYFKVFSLSFDALREMKHEGELVPNLYVVVEIRAYRKNLSVTFRLASLEDGLIKGTISTGIPVEEGMIEWIVLNHT